MKINKNYVQTLIFVLVYLFAIYFWTQPLQDRKVPYGEYDAMSHFEVGDYMAYNDKSFMYLPPYIDIRYGNDNDFKPHTLWYAPTFHASLGLMQVFGGQRIVPIFLMNAILATFVIVTVYFVIRSLFGFLPAILSAILIVFSPRDFMPYIWGQWPERFAYAFIPVILYCFYKYLINYDKKENTPIYLYFTALFSGISFLIHPLAFLHVVFSLILFYIFIAIKNKRLYINANHIIISILIFLILFFMFPYQNFRIFPEFSGNKEESVFKLSLSRIFSWSPNAEDFIGSVPPSYFSYREMHGLWTLPFLVIGLSVLIINRKERDLLLLAWLIGLYIMLHRDLFGKAEFLHRSLSATAHIFSPIMAIGAIYLINLVKVNFPYKKFVKYGIALIFIYFALSINMPAASKILNKEIYNPYTQSGFFTTLNDAEFQASQWILDNAPKNVNVTVLGIPYQDQVLSATSKKIRWMAAVSQHVTRFYYFREDKEIILKSPEWYIMLDYTMIGPLNDQETFNFMQDFEKTALSNHTLVYNKDNIEVYKFEPK
ncbi:glycosyltransferase family 39 protein [Candidatus Woesearchaeota archaeon]|nr:glycosyltransferase family 39 protein [Candidatus Woesearchaeota archaeon]